MGMSKFFAFLIASSVLLASSASWYWPFESSEDDEPPRLSELMEPASILIDEASELAGDGKISEAVERYRKALIELDRIEAENPDRADKPEFATLKTKRAYVSAAIDSMLLSQAKLNARPVAVSDTTELERKLARERGERSDDPEMASDAIKPEDLPEVEEASAEADRRSIREEMREDRLSKRKKGRKGAEEKPESLTDRERVLKAIAEDDYRRAERILGEMLYANPKDVTALNLRAICEIHDERYDDAERSLSRAIKADPQDYAAYCNLARLLVRVYPEKRGKARRCYEKARELGCPEDAELKEVFE